MKAIYKRELRAYFNSMTGWVFAAALSVFIGIYFTAYNLMAGYTDFSYALTATLIVFMALDYATGLIVAGVFHKSSKSETGALESKAGWKGLCRKCMSLLFVLIAHRLDLALNINYIRDAVILGFMTNELISIVENAGLMGIPLPSVITKAIDVLTKKAESSNQF